MLSEAPRLFWGPSTPVEGTLNFLSIYLLNRCKKFTSYTFLSLSSLLYRKNPLFFSQVK